MLCKSTITPYDYSQNHYNIDYKGLQESQTPRLGTFCVVILVAFWPQISTRQNPHKKSTAGLLILCVLIISFKSFKDSFCDFFSPARDQKRSKSLQFTRQCRLIVSDNWISNSQKKEKASRTNWRWSWPLLPNYLLIFRLCWPFLCTNSENRW